MEIKRLGSRMTVLAVGAAGNVAGLVVPALVERGAKVRGLVRKPEQVDEARRRGATEVIVGDLADLESLMTALQGVEAVFYVGPVFVPNEVQMGQNMIQAAGRAGVRKFVFSSVIHPILSKLPNHAAKAQVEEALINSDLDYTILHPTVLFQNYSTAWAKVLQTGILEEPWSPDSRFSRVDYRDVAEVAAIALTEERLAYGTFELCSSDILNRHEVAALISEVLEKKITVGTTDPDTLGKIPDDMRTMCEHYNHRGLLGITWYYAPSSVGSREPFAPISRNSRVRHSVYSEPARNGTLILNQKGHSKMKLTANTILITGGATGIGFALAQQLMERRNRVIVCGRSEESLRKAHAQVPTLITRVCDIANTESRKSMVNWLNTNHSDLNVVINNAGVEYRRNFKENAALKISIRR